jgi:hypothetical protein
LRAPADGARPVTSQQVDDQQARRIRGLDLEVKRIGLVAQIELVLEVGGASRTAT